ncbi:hypothetical protein [Bacillus cereus]
MKKYKKIAVIMPLAGMLTTGLGTLRGPASTFADTIPQLKIVPIYTNLAKNNMNDNEQLKKELSQFFGGEVSNIQLEMINTNSNPIQVHITSAQPIGSKDDVIDFIGYDNYTNEMQSHKTPEQKVINKMSVTTTNASEMHTGLKSETEFSLGIPLFAEGKEKITVELGVTYKKSLDETVENSTEVTYPSQTINAAPGGRTTLLNQVQKTKFDGIYTGSAVIKSFDRKNSDGQVQIYEGDVLYQIYKYRSSIKNGENLSDSIENDALNKKLIVKNHLVPFTGKAGYTTQATARFIPFDKTKSEIKMPIAEYNKRVANGISLYAK